MGLGIFNLSVKIDRSSSIISELDYKRAPVFQEELLFLKVVIKGKASLFTYKDNSIIRYFYTKPDSSEVLQLVHKIYLKNSDEILHNNTFQQQINADLVCLNFITKGYIEKINYDRAELEKVFLKYNECADPGFAIR